MITAMAHNILKAMTKRRFFRRDAASSPRPAAYLALSSLLRRHCVALIRSHQRPLLAHCLLS